LFDGGIKAVFGSVLRVAYTDGIVNEEDIGELAPAVVKFFQAIRAKEVRSVQSHSIFET